MKTWRQQQRQRLLEDRAGLSPAERETIQQHCLQNIAAYLAQCEPCTLGLYWPIKGELDCRDLAEDLISNGWELAVPVMNEETRTLSFARWQPGTPMHPGAWNIPIPVDIELLQPVRYLVPLVGFDEANYRLGYGGGYYDRTLANIRTRVETIGVGMEMGRCQTIHPHEHDIPMNVIITEAGVHTAATYKA